MKVLYDHQTFSLQDYGGISRLYTELMRPVHDEPETELSILVSNNVNLEELSQFRHINLMKESTWKYKIPIIYNLNKLYSIYKIKNSSYDIFHPTYYDSYFLKYLKGKPFVVTVHDMIHELILSRSKGFIMDKIVAGKKVLLQEAARIIAVSECTKKDVVEMLGIDKNKIDVIPLASSMERNNLKKPEKLIENDYILFVGNREAYKNFSFFLESVALLLNQQKELKVICGGGGKFTEKETLLISKLRLQNKVVQVAIKNDITFISLYSNALCFVFPSLYEGFGIPILEAFSCGCPCALSNRSSLPEVGSDAAVYFNPEDSESVYSAIFQLLNNEELRREKIKKGTKEYNYFHGKKHAGKLLGCTVQSYKTFANYLFVVLRL